jgi:hypothetical protein
MCDVCTIKQIWNKFEQLLVNKLKNFVTSLDLYMLADYYEYKYAYVALEKDLERGGDSQCDTYAQ